MNYNLAKIIFRVVGRQWENRLNQSKAASAPVIMTPCNYMIANNPKRSKAASVSVFNKVNVIHDFLKSNGRL